ncbi:hypothetical protein JW935_29230 [candidate division KSB1 bacterium]|nr:hypothetical protein [candidate division KSB1 bacterium]
MENYTRCSRCILPNSLKSITLDENGVCNYCLQYEKDFSIWNEIAPRKLVEFERIIHSAKKLKRPYDCLIPLSGGKDSTFVLYLCDKIYNLKCLAVTFDNGYLTKPARNNIKNALKSSSADHVFYQINKTNSQKLFKTFVIKTGDFCNACMCGINYSIEIATKMFNIPLIIKGSGRRVQYVSQIKEVSSLNTPSYFANIIKGEKSEPHFKHFARNKFALELQKIVGGISDILKMSRKNLLRYIPQHILLYDYFYKPYPEIVEILKRDMGWNDYENSVEHLDCELRDIQFFLNTLKIPNITKYTFHNSGLIRQGILSREKALLIEEKELNNNPPPQELFEFLGDISITYEDYKKFVVNSDKTKYEPKFQKVVRSIYHNLRKL